MFESLISSVSKGWCRGWGGVSHAVLISCLKSPSLVFSQVIGFSSETVAAFIGVVGILSILAQVRSHFHIRTSKISGSQAGAFSESLWPHRHCRTPARPALPLSSEWSCCLLNNKRGVAPRCSVELWLCSDCPRQGHAGVRRSVSGARWPVSPRHESRGLPSSSRLSLHTR